MSTGYSGILIDLPSGKLTVCELENGRLHLIYPFKVVIFQSYVSLFNLGGFDQETWGCGKDRIWVYNQ